MSQKQMVFRSISTVLVLFLTFSGFAQNQLKTEEIAINPLINGTLITPETDAPLAIIKAKPDSERINIENMNPVLREVEGNALENSKSYNQPSLPIAPQVVNAISDFINNKLLQR